MLLPSFLLYVLPFAARLLLSDDAPLAEDVVLSLLPTLAVVAPTLWLPRWIHDPETEHVVRHFLYAAGFGGTALASIRWQNVDLRLEWGVALTGYLVVGFLALLWFCVSHLLENSRVGEMMHTHHGDIVILPLVLVSIGTFANDVPQEVFRFSRSIVFFTPVVVAWATLNFIAFLEFATHTTTRHSSRGFSQLAFAALVVASLHLLLLELQSPPIAFVSLSVSAAFMYQRMPRPADFPFPVRTGREAGTTLVAVLLGWGMSRLFARRWGGGLVIYLVPSASLLVASLSVPHVTGDRWVWPSAGHASLGCLATLFATGLPVNALDSVAVYASFLLSTFLCERLCPALRYPRPSRGGVPPSASTEGRPQDRLPWWSWSKLTRGRVGTLPIPLLSGRYDERTVVASVEETGRNRAPPSFDGVWWMEGNTFPITLLSLQRARWLSPTSARLWMAHPFTREATLSSLLLWACQSLLVLTLTVEEGGKWIRTDVAALPPLNLLHDTYWGYRVSEDEYVRVGYDRRGEEVWRYRLLRVATRDGATTRFHRDFLAAQKGRRFWPILF